MSTIPDRRPGFWSRIALGCVMLTTLSLLAGCRGDGGRMASPTTGGTLVIAAATDLDFANSLVSREAYTQEVLLNLLFLPLLRYDEEFGYEPRLARSWEIEGDTSLTFHLRDDVTWHDGVPTTAHDVAFTFERVIDPVTTYSNPRAFVHWHRVEVLDSFTVRFKITPHPDPLDAWPDLAVMPAHLLDSIPSARLRQAPFNHSPVGNGPFRFVSLRSNDRWIFEANDDFPAELGGRPYLDRVIWRVIPESSSRITELLTGGADLIAGISAREHQELEPMPGVRTIVRPSRKFQALIWNGRDESLGDPRIRRALALAIDRGQILEVMRGGYGQLATGPVYPAHWAFDSTLTPLPYDPGAARRLLAEAGYHDRPGGNALELELLIPTGNEYNRNVAGMVQAQLARVGVDLRLRLLDFAALVDQITSPERDFDAVFLSWESGYRLDLGDLFHSAAIDGAFQFASYGNPEIDHLLDQVMSLEREEARPLWQRIQEILHEEQPWTIFYYTPDLYVISERLQGVEMDIRGALTGIEGWWKDGS